MVFVGFDSRTLLQQERHHRMVVSFLFYKEEGSRTDCSATRTSVAREAQAERNLYFANGKMHIDSRTLVQAKPSGGHICEYYLAYHTKSQYNGITLKKGGERYG